VSMVEYTHFGESKASNEKKEKLGEVAQQDEPQVPSQAITIQPKLYDQVKAAGHVYTQIMTSKQLFSLGISYLSKRAS